MGGRGGSGEEYESREVVLTLSSMMADRKVSASMGEPSLMCLCCSSRPCFTVSQHDSGTYILETAEHFCPPYSKAERSVPFTTLSRLADECTKWKFLPPHSAHTHTHTTTIHSLSNLRTPQFEAFPLCTDCHFVKINV